MFDKKISRRSFLTKSGALVVGFSFAPAVASFLTSATPALAGPTTTATNQVDAWLAIDANGGVTVYSGKVELGTGVQTALSQIVAEELYLDFPQIVDFVQGDTSLTPNQGYTAGSNTIYGEGPILRQAAATAFQQLLTLASQQLGVSTSKLVAQGGSIGIGQSMKNAALVRAVDRRTTIQPRGEHQRRGQGSPAATPSSGSQCPELTSPARSSGSSTYVQDVVVPGMLHGRVVRPASRNATLAGTSHVTAARPSSGFSQVGANGNFVGVVATDEWAAIQAASQLNVTWNPGAPLAATDDGTAATRNSLIQALQDPTNIFDTRPVGTLRGNAASALASAAKTRQATYFTPYQMHAAIGPSCAVADVRSAPMNGSRPRSGPERRASTSCRARSPNCSACRPPPCT